MAYSYIFTWAMGPVGLFFDIYLYEIVLSVTDL